MRAAGGQGGMVLQGRDVERVEMVLVEVCVGVGGKVKGWWWWWYVWQGLVLVGIGGR